jgi:penicillin-binding protein 2
VRKIESRAGDLIKEYQPELIRKIEIPSEVFATVKEGLYRVVNEPGGTAFLSKSKKTLISGKTGTAQVRAFADISAVRQCMALDVKDRHHGWFVGYAPRENPQIAVVAIAENACHGSNAAHIVQEVIDAYVTKQALLTGQPLPEEAPAKVVAVKKRERPRKKQVEAADEADGETLAPVQVDPGLQKKTAPEPDTSGDDE